MGTQRLGRPAGMTIEVLGQEIRLLFLTEENGLEVLLTVTLVLALLLLRWLARGLSRLVLRGLHNERARFWTRQGINLLVAVLLFLGFLSIWFDDPGRLATGIGLVTAGLAFSLQRVITALAGYVVILRGDTFDIGDRITMGGVRGDVIALGFVRTTIMEMGQPPAVRPGAVGDLEPRVCWRLTDNRLELTVRFLTGVYGVRDVKDAMSREVLAELDAAGIGLASATFEVAGCRPCGSCPMAAGSGDQLSGWSSKKAICGGALMRAGMTLKPIPQVTNKRLPWAP